MDIVSRFEEDLRVNTEELNKIRLADIGQLNKEFEIKIELVKEGINEKMEEIYRLNSIIIDCNTINDDLKLLLEDLRLEFKQCIERFTHLDKTEAEFLFPIPTSIKSIRDLNMHLKK